MSQIEKQSFKETGSQDAASFLSFLVKEGFRLSLITPEQLESIQYQIAELLANRCNRWTGGTSSSVTIETGQRIQQSVFYTVGYYLKSLSDPESALELLKTWRLQDLFEKGLRLLESDRIEAELLLHEIREHCFPTDVIAYNDTIQAGLGLFFSSYDIDFGAHESPGSIDYPLGNDKMNLTGLEYVHTYLDKLQMENVFCGFFPADEIHSLFRGYDQQYQELLFSMYDLVFVNAVGSFLLGRNEADLSISRLDRQFLQNKLAPLTLEARNLLVDEAVESLRNTLSITDPAFINYLKQSSANLKTRLNSALENIRLEHLFLSFSDDAEAQFILFCDNPPMENDRFCALTEAIRECKLTSDKILLMQIEPLSIRDIVDLLEGDCFFGGEFIELFLAMEDLRLAVLLQNMPMEPTSQDFLRAEFDQAWQFHFDRFLMQMAPLHRSEILNKAGLIRAESPSEQRFC
jgi:hypothetical protein